MDLPLNVIKIPCPDYFSLDQIFDCGQAFRFTKREDGSYRGVVFGRAARFEVKDGELITTCGGPDCPDSLWRRYFDIDRDYGAIRAAFSRDPVLARAMDYGRGIRILRQDLWEMLITFILSQNNNIPRIRSLVESLCRAYGEKIEFMGDEFYTFPTAERIAADPSALYDIRCGYRAPYIEKTAALVAGGGYSLEELEKMSTPDARRDLLTLTGIGPKVADCILLFGMGRFDAFPVDVWMKRAISLLYNAEKFDPAVFGGSCGVAQQYLFYYARGMSLGKERTK